MSEFERAWAFMDALYARAAERTVPFRFGTAIVHERLGRVHDLNYLRVHRPEDASADELAAEAERIQAPLGLRHRALWFDDAAAVARLEPELRQGGWEPRYFVLMTLHREPDREADLSVVRETDPTVLRPIWAEGIRSAPFDKDEEVVRQLVEHKDALATAVPTRYYAAYVDEEPVSYCELYSAGGVGQVEAVLTLEQHRGRGLARATIGRAVTQSRTDGNELTFLVADANDWPKELYRKLGFDTVGRYGRFGRRLG